MIYPTKKSGRVWFSNWENNIYRKLDSGTRDPYDSDFIARGNGNVEIDGNGVAIFEGDSPRMYVYDDLQNKKWSDVEVTVYSKRVSETGTKSSQGIVIGARSEHQNVTDENLCSASTYYGRLLYDGRAVFQKEMIHGEESSVNMPEENNLALWNNPNNSFPFEQWIGLKFIVKNNEDKKTVTLELYRDLTDGFNGGTWEKVAEYTDIGDWLSVNNKSEGCDENMQNVLLKPGTSVFIRNDLVKDVEYKKFSIREI